MKNLDSYITEKLVIGKNIIHKENKSWDKLIQDWIDEWSKDDFEYLMLLIDRFLEDETFEGDTQDEYEPFLQYEKNNKFKEYFKDKILKFKLDVENQVKNMK